MDADIDGAFFQLCQFFDFDEPSVPELPSEVVEEILTIVFSFSTFEERRGLLCLSRDLCRSLGRTAYRVVQITTLMRFKEFLSWMDTKSDDFLRVTIKALHVNLIIPGPTVECLTKEQWTAMLSRLGGLQTLFIFCSYWNGHDCLFAAWEAIFVLPELKSLRLDWHFNEASLTIPPPYVYPCYALEAVTHLTIVGNGKHCFDLNDIIQFRALSHLAIVNPTAGYSRDDVLYWEKYLVRLRLLVILVFWNEDLFIEGFDKTKKIVGFVGVGDVADEFRSQANGGETMWTRAEATLAERHRLQFEIFNSECT
ncbi:hypothetical protein DL96DRAFT_1616499 [Flagelloscypha sp. PMI_526]|nr:hypothetical protein DL96DRAFT_1616499 [Flagelloscypha sp. PMI_526]